MRKINTRKLFLRTSSPEMRAFLDYVGPKWYIETEVDEDGSSQGGDVDKVIRDQYGIPVCFRVKVGDRKYDYISADRVSFFEPYDCFVSSYEEFDDANSFDSVNAWATEHGYVYDEDRCCWRNPETGDEFTY